AFGFPGVLRAQAQATVAGGRDFVGSSERRVYSLSVETACIYWAFDSDGPVRTAVSLGQNGSGWAAYCGDQHANAYAVDAVTGSFCGRRMSKNFRGRCLPEPLRWKFFDMQAVSALSE